MSSENKVKELRVMPQFDFYFAYKNYIHHDYGASWDLEKQLIKKHNVYEGYDRTTIKYVTEDIEKSNVLIKKGYWAVSISHSRVSAVDQIKDFYIQKNYGCSICFDTGRCFPYYSNVHVIVKRQEDIIRIAKQVELQKSNIPNPKEEIVEKIKSQFPLIKNPRVDFVYTVNKELFLITGEFDYSSGDGYPFWGILLQKDERILIEENCEFWDVLLIDGKHYFVAYWQEPECGKRALEIYTLEGEFLKKIFVDSSDAT